MRAQTECMINSRFDQRRKNMAEENAEIDRAKKAKEQLSVKNLLNDNSDCTF